MPHGFESYTFYQNYWEPLGKGFLKQSHKGSDKDYKNKKYTWHTNIWGLLVVIVLIVGLLIAIYYAPEPSHPRPTTYPSPSHYVPVDNYIISEIISIFWKGVKVGYYAPGDTHVISHFMSISTLCDGLTISGDTGATLYLLSKKPSLSGPVHNLTARPPTTIATGSLYFYYLKYHLYAGSKLNMTYCLDEPSSSPAVSFFLIKGSKNWGWWKDDPLHLFSDVYNVSLKIDNPCSGGSKHLQYNFTSTNDYYFAFISDTDLRIIASLFLQRTEYDIANISIADSCSIGFVDRCRVSVPYWSDYTTLLSVHDGPISEANININWSCDPRDWVFVLIFVIFLFFVMAACFIICVFIPYAHRHQIKWVFWLLRKIVACDNSRLKEMELQLMPNNPYALSAMASVFSKMPGATISSDKPSASVTSDKLLGKAMPDYLKGTVAGLMQSDTPILEPSDTMDARCTQ